MNTHRLYRSRRDKQLAGVAGGMAEYLEIDPTLVRILWILSVFLGGFTILLYVILAFVMPLAPAAPSGPYRPYGPSRAPGGSWGPGGSWVPATSPGQGGSPAAGASADPSTSSADPSTSTADPSTSPAGGAVETGGDPAGDASPTEGWNAAQAASWSGPAWTGDQGWSTPVPEPAVPHRRGPGAAVYAGVLLVVFGAIALADMVIPGVSGITLVPALLVALGVALLVGSMRRPADPA